MAGAVMYLQLSAPALWFYVMAECLKRYLLAQVKVSLCAVTAWAEAPSDHHDWQRCLRVLRRPDAALRSTWGASACRLNIARATLRLLQGGDWKGWRVLCCCCQMQAVLVQGVVTPATIVTACSAALAPLYNWVLVDKLEVGLAGAALANDAVQVRTRAQHPLLLAKIECAAVSPCPLDACSVRSCPPLHCTGMIGMVCSFRCLALHGTDGGRPEKVEHCTTHDCRSFACGQDASRALSSLESAALCLQRRNMWGP